MLHKLILSLAFALLLGISQQSALTHQIDHLADLGAHSGQQEQMPHQGDCDHCLASSHFANGLGSDYAFIVATNAIATEIACKQPQHLSRSAQPYTARAPPQIV